MRALLAAVVCAGCATYTAKPLRPDDILERLEAERSAAGDVTSLAAATERMRAHNPRVLEARAAYAAALAFADVKTPLPNPTLGAGALLLDGADILASRQWGAEASLGWTVLLGGRRRLQDDLNAVRAEAAAVGAAGVEREEYLGLRGAYARLAAAQSLAAAREDLARVVDESLAVLKRMPTATALDVGGLDLESRRARADVFRAREEQAEARAAIAGRVGAVAGRIGTAAMPALPAAVPDRARLHELLLRDHPKLARRREAYRVSERELRLEVARQVPEIEIGPSFEREEGVNRFGLGIGIEVPIFDRNQGGIARGEAHREEARAAFAAEVARGLARIDAARARLESRRARAAYVRDEVLPAAAAQRALARRSLEAGVADPLRFLAALRADRAARLEGLEADHAVLEAWLDLEEACGAPLLAFGEQES